MVCYFVTFHRESRSPQDRNLDPIPGLERLVKSIDGLSEARLHTPATAHDPMLDDGAPPALVLQLFFQNINHLESALATKGPLQDLPGTSEILSLGECKVDQQAMLTRNFSVNEPTASAGAGDVRCTYLVRYQGPAQDTNLWLSDYLAGHPPLMRRLPGIRRLEIFTRMDWCGALPWPRSDDLQRNQVVFDSPAALNAALNSPLRTEMREHFNNLPPFEGGVTHFPMLTRTLSLT